MEAGSGGDLETAAGTGGPDSGGLPSQGVGGAGGALRPRPEAEGVESPCCSKYSLLDELFGRLEVARRSPEPLPLPPARLPGRGVRSSGASSGAAAATGAAAADAAKAA